MVGVKAKDTHARVIGAIRAWVVVVVLVGGSASSNALARVIGARVPFGADISAGRVDRTAKLSGASVARIRWRRGVLVVAIGSGNDNVILVAPLALVRRGGRVDLGAP